jgi:hypothetical protein
MSQPFLFSGCRFAGFLRVCPLSVERIFGTGLTSPWHCLQLSTQIVDKLVRDHLDTLPARLLPVCTNE